MKETKQTDQWIIDHAEELKAELLKKAKRGDPKPAPGTLLGRAFDLFTRHEEVDLPPIPKATSSKNFKAAVSCLVSSAVRLHSIVAQLAERNPKLMGRIVGDEETAQKLLGSEAVLELWVKWQAENTKE